jgi:hypothetical protein
VKGGSLVAPQSQADILKRAVIVIVAGQANVGFLCKPRVPVMSLIAKLEPDCLNQSANTRSPGMVRNLNASRG